MRIRHAICTLALVLGACSPGAADRTKSAATEQAQAEQAQAAVHPESGLPVVPLTVDSAGKVHRFRVEVATTPQEQARGLMFRTAMGSDEGMVFPHRPPRPASFWMKNTVLPLDIIFVGEDGRILNIEANAVPYSEEPRRSTGITAFVLELNGGRAAELGIEPGDRVSW